MKDKVVTSVVFEAVPIRAGDLKPGDMFSTVGPDYWKYAADGGGVGERVYLRTNAAASVAEDADTMIYKVTVRPKMETDQKGGNR